MPDTERKSPLWDTLTPSAYRRALSVVPTSVAVAAGMSEGRPVGMVIGTFTSVSMTPPLVGFFGDNRSTTLGPLLRCERLTFSLLREEDSAVCAAFRRPLPERFAGVDWEVTEHGTPAVKNAPLVVHTRLHHILDAGDHRCVLAEVLGLEVADHRGRPLVFHRQRLSRLDPGRMPDHELWQLGWEEPG